MSNYSRITTLRNMQEQIAHAGTLIADLQKTIVALQGTNAALKGTNELLRERIDGLQQDKTLLVKQREGMVTKRMRASDRYDDALDKAAWQHDLQLQEVRRDLEKAQEEVKRQKRIAKVAKVAAQLV